MSSLLEMPDLVMKLVLGKLDYVSVQRLRKTCRTLRNFIDDVKPESNLSAFRILFTPKYLRFFIWFKDLENLQIEYITVDNGCRIVPEGGEYQCCPMEFLYNFQKIHINIKEATEEFLGLKEKILNSPQMENFEFHFRQSDAFDKLTEIFGEISFSDTQYMNGYKRHWFFAYSENSDNLLEITFFENYKYYAFDINKKVIFSKISRRMVPSGAIIYK
ncbi:hypothetical protein L3Y34_017159 [Caenorhabditis briggsae]|uniref:F-box domain-containing protein n=1 Tax=Caenorhabditis briggsae TaxID=6238 RepID=A0AAE9DI04_CAEBR|nr:hypothetical protein L3Y34_017159 [Caenorhabditis briggsae]